MNLTAMRQSIGASNGSESNRPQFVGAMSDDQVPPAAFWSDQDTLDTLADHLSVLLSNNPNFFTVGINVPNNSITLYTSGALSTAEQSAAQSLLPPDVSLLLAPVKISREQEQTLLGYFDARVVAGLALSHYGIDLQSGRFDIYLQSGSLSAADLGTLAQFGANSYFIGSDSVYALNGGRNDDRTPYVGGSDINGPLQGNNSYDCSSGFSARSTTNGSYYLITAAHCYESADPRIWTSSYLLGSVSAADTSWDAAYIKVATGAVASSIYDGSYPSLTQMKAVVGATTNHVGDSYCQSGVSSYAICGLTIYDPEQHVSVHSDYNNTTYTATEWPLTRQGEEAVAQGDSGGPVFKNTNNNTQALAAGIVSSGSAGMTCPSYISTSCDQDMYMGDINNMISTRSLDITP